MQTVNPRSTTSKRTAVVLLGFAKKHTRGQDAQLAHSLHILKVNLSAGALVSDAIMAAERAYSVGGHLPCNRIKIKRRRAASSITAPTSESVAC